MVCKSFDDAVRAGRMERVAMYRKEKISVRLGTELVRMYASFIPKGFTALGTVKVDWTDKTEYGALLKGNSGYWLRSGAPDLLISLPSDAVVAAIKEASK
jgi:hypothetical protein